MSAITRYSFDKQRLDAVTIDGEQWLTLGQIVTALGLKNADALRQSYWRKRHLFKAGETQLLILPTADRGMQETRAFNLMGAHRLASWSNGPKRDAFREWVLAVALGKASGERQPAQRSLPGVEQPAIEMVLSIKHLMQFLEPGSIAMAEAQALMDGTAQPPPDPRLEALIDRYDRSITGLSYEMKELRKIRKDAKAAGFSARAVKRGSDLRKLARKRLAAGEA